MSTRREVRLERLCAPDVRAYMDQLNLLYIPIAPLEWHGPHLPYGTDPLNAYAVSLVAAEKFGGLVHPIVYAGTEVQRRPELVAAFGLPPGTPVVGMDMPGLALKSFYMPPDAFRSVAAAILQTAIAVGFTKIVIVNGHGADEQKRILRELADEMSGPEVAVLYFIALDTGDAEALRNIGHADIFETEFSIANTPELVDLGRLPKSGGIRCADYAIVDSQTFEGIPTLDFTTRDDPRDADAARGRDMVAKVVTRIGQVIRITSPTER